MANGKAKGYVAPYCGTVFRLYPNRTQAAQMETSRVVVVGLAPDVRRTSLGTGISEHPFGTIKGSMGADHFLLRGLPRVEAESSPMCLGYNLTRAANLLGFEAPMGLVGGAASQALSWLRRTLGTSRRIWHLAAACRRRPLLPAGI